MNSSCRSVTTLVAVALCAVMLGACAFVELSGTATRKTGEFMTDYSKGNDGFLGKVAELGGQVNTTVGTAIEGAAQRAAKEGAPTAPKSQATADPQRQGTRAMSMAQAQRRLTELGYQPGPADGTMGKRTSDALAEFQRKSGLQVSGKLNAETMEVLRAARVSG